MNGLIVGGLLAAIYLIINFLLPVVPVNALVKSYVFQPLLWLLPVLVVLRLPGYRTLAGQRLQKTLFRMALGIGCLQIVLYMISGFFIGFGKNPASFTLLGIAQNGFYLAAMLAGMELARAWLIARFGRRHGIPAVALATLFFTLLSIPLNQLTGFKFEIQSGNLVISSWVPLLAENLIASFLALLGGARASLAYRGLLAAFWWFCPILPDLNYSLKGLIGVAIPVLGIIAVNSVYSAQMNRGKAGSRRRNTAFPAGWVVTALVSVVIVWFAVGAFPIKPAVIPSGSMIPAVYPGDVVIVAKNQTANIQLGDIIEYRNPTANINIVHRVIEIRGAGSRQYFITQGDNNDAPDIDPVPAQNVLGKVIFNIPRVGWISLFLKSLAAAG